MFFGAKIADSIERNAFFNENHVFFFFFLETFVCQRFGLKCSDLSADPLTPLFGFWPARLRIRTFCVFFFGGGRGAGVRKQDDKTRELPGPGPGPGPGWQATGPGQSSSKQTDKQAHTVQNPHIFPIWAAVPSANTACWLARLSVCLHRIWRHILAPVFCAADGHGILKPQCFTQGRCLSQTGKQIRTTQVKPQ